MNMKKIIFIFVAAFAALFASASEYRVLVLGDIHFENAKYHVYPGVIAWKKRSAHCVFLGFNSS